MNMNLQCTLGVRTSHCTVHRSAGSRSNEPNTPFYLARGRSQLELAGASWEAGVHSIVDGEGRTRLCSETSKRTNVNSDETQQL